MRIFLAFYFDAFGEIKKKKEKAESNIRGGDALERASIKMCYTSRRLQPATHKSGVSKCRPPNHIWRGNSHLDPLRQPTSAEPIAGNLPRPGWTRPIQYTYIYLYESPQRQARNYSAEVDQVPSIMPRLTILLLFCIGKKFEKNFTISVISANSRLVTSSYRYLFSG